MSQGGCGKAGLACQEEFGVVSTDGDVLPPPKDNERYRLFSTVNYPAADMGLEKDWTANCSSSLMSRILSK